MKGIEMLFDGDSGSNSQLRCACAGLGVGDQKGTKH